MPRPQRNAAAGYDAAQTTADNRRHWANADGLSARAANSPEVRRKLRMRSRYETDNNSYLRGIIRTLANDVIGTGPRLQVRTNDSALNKRVSDLFEAWSLAIGLAEKLRTMRQSKAVDGESIGLLKTNRRLSTPVTLDITPIEADQCATPGLFFPDPQSIDGIEFDEDGNPAFYTILKSHPGDLFSIDPDFDTVPARLVIHWFTADRPSQCRGVPEGTASLELFAQLRRFTLATIAAAETAADFAAMLETEAPPEGCETDADPFEELEITKRMMTVLPSGSKLNQLKAEHPSTTYPDFKRENISEAARPWSMPYNIAACNSAGYNYSSGRLDHQTYFKAIGIEQYQCETVVLEPIFNAWITEAIAAGVIPKLADGYPHQWFWDGNLHVDPSKEANAQATLLENNTTTLADEWAAKGHDWREKLLQRAEEIRFMAENGIPQGSKGTPVTDTQTAIEDQVDEAMQNASYGPRRIRANAAIKAPKNFTIEATGKVEIQAGQADGKRPTFSISAYTGAVIQVGGFYTPIIIDLAGFKASREKIPILFNHDDSRVVGQTDSIAIDASGVRLTGTITSDHEDAANIITNAKNGFDWQASVGASIVRQEFLKAGEKAVVNGRDVTGPLLIAREARLHETSFVAIGADSQTSVAVAASKPTSSKGAHSMNPFDKWIEAKGFDPAALDDTQKASLKAMYDAEIAAAAVVAAKTPEDKPKKALKLHEIVAEAKAEEKRVDEITAIVANATRDWPNRAEEFGRMADVAIEAKSTPSEFELEMLRATRARIAPGGYFSSGDAKSSAKVIEAAICLDSRLEKPEKHYDERTLNAASDRFPHGIGLRDLLMMSARDNGYSGHTSSDVRGLLEAAFRGGIRANMGFSTISLPGILSNVANKFLVEAFMAVESGWRDIASTKSVRDFKANSSYALTGNFTYEKVGAGGELKHATVGEETYTVQAETYGKMFAITRKDIINDDLGALTGIARRLGRGSALAINEVFWTEFLADVTVFWASGHSNVSTGGGSALASAGLKAAMQVARKQTDPDGKPLGVTPRILLVPPELEITADELMTSVQVNTGGSSSTDKVPNRNVWASKFKPVVSTYLSNATITGYSTTAWWLLADPRDLSTIEVAFLNGRDMPVIDTAEADFNTLGVQFRGYHDFGVNKQEYRASVRSAGT